MTLSSRHTPCAVRQFVGRPLQRVVLSAFKQPGKAVLRVAAHLMCLLLCSIALADDQAHTSEQIEFFEKKIRPVLIEHCYECHAAGAKIIQGGLRVDHRAGLLKGGDSGPSIDLQAPEQSSLIKALRYEDDVEMPPKGKLSDSIIADFEKWIAMGAPDPRVADELSSARTVDLEEGRKFWTFEPIADPQPPSVNDRSWPLEPIDHFILDKQEAAGIQPVASAATELSELRGRVHCRI